MKSEICTYTFLSNILYNQYYKAILVSYLDNTFRDVYIYNELSKSIKSAADCHLLLL